jgi:alpha-tubulin suppressor-like RCC1 family protein
MNRSKNTGRISAHLTRSGIVANAIRSMSPVIAALGTVTVAASAHADSWIRYWGTGASYGNFCTPQGGRLATSEIFATNLNGEVLILRTGHSTQTNPGPRRGWGSNATGLFSWPPTGSPEEQVRDFPDLAVTPFLFHTQVSLGQGHAVAIADGLVNGMYLVGTVVCWGWNDVGQSNVPQEPWGIPLYQIVQVSCGLKHTVALRSNGQVRAWGSDSYGQSSPPAILVNGLPDATQVAAGGLHSMALLGNGLVACWGAGSVSDPVDNFFLCGQSVPPVSLGPVIAVAAGGLHSVALRPNGSVVCWGAGSGESMFNFNTGQSRVPADLGPCTRVSASTYATAALQTDGIVRVWGLDQAFGQCAGQCDVPAALGTLTDFRSTFYGVVVVSNEMRPTCAADINPTCRVDGNDLGMLLASWGPQPAGNPADINDDGDVNGADLGDLLSAWGPCAN